MITAYSTWVKLHGEWKHLVTGSLDECDAVLQEHYYQGYSESLRICPAGEHPSNDPDPEPYIPPHLEGSSPEEIRRLIAQAARDYFLRNHQMELRRYYPDNTGGPFVGWFCIEGQWVRACQADGTDEAAATLYRMAHEQGVDNLAVLPADVIPF